eukprot:gene41306-51145_t
MDPGDQALVPALVVRVVPEPEPGSDEISHAVSDSWVGTHGYRRTDGKMQIARAFLGCSGVVRSSPDGNSLAYLAKDEKEHESDVSGNVRWHPDGKH